MVLFLFFFFNGWVVSPWGFPSGSVVKNLPVMQEMKKTWVQSLGQKDLLEEGIATHSSIRTWRIPWTEEPGGLQSMGLQSQTRLKWLSTAHPTGLPCWLSGKEPACQCRRFRFNPCSRKITWGRKWKPTPIFFPGETHGQRNLVGYSPWGHRVGYNLVTQQQIFHYIFVPHFLYPLIYQWTFRLFPCFAFPFVNNGWFHSLFFGWALVVEFV